MYTHPYNAQPQAASRSNHNQQQYPPSPTRSDYSGYSSDGDANGHGRGGSGGGGGAHQRNNRNNHHQPHYRVFNKNGRGGNGGNGGHKRPRPAGMDHAGGVEEEGAMVGGAGGPQAKQQRR